MWRDMPRHDSEVFPYHIPFVAFCLKNENTLKARKRRHHNFNSSKSIYLYVKSLVWPGVAVTKAS